MFCDNIGLDPLADSDCEIVVVVFFLLSEAAVINLERRSRECWAAQAGQLWDTRPHLRQPLDIATISASYRI
jgi:hypothetical protein